MSTTPVVHLELWISLQIFKKIGNGPNGIIRGFRETYPWRKPEVNNRVGYINGGCGRGTGSVLPSPPFSTLPQLDKKLGLKGQCHDFSLRHVFSWIIVPQSPWVLTIQIALFQYLLKIRGAIPNNTNSVVSIFIKNPRSYSQLKVPHHRCCWHQWQMDKNFQVEMF